MIFTATEQVFFDHHKIPTSSVLNATGLTKLQVTNLMAKDEFLIAIGVSPCDKSGHRMRLKSWHCVQCFSANLGFRKNYHNAGFVYVCASKEKNILKIGSSQLLDARVSKLNSSGYGGAVDWKLINSWKFEKVGTIEFAAQRALREFRVQGAYAGQSRSGECEELFSCSVEKAIQEIEKAANESGTKPNSNSTNHVISNSTLGFVQRKNVEFRKGEIVHHTKALQWGSGVVISDSTKEAVTVQFSDGQQRQFKLPLLALVKIQ